MTDAELAALARQARDKAYAPYSGFRVGAALLTGNEQVFLGANMENASLGLSVCAERNAIAAAVLAGGEGIKQIAIASDGDRCVPPCGACLQVMREFADDLDILLVDADGSLRPHRLADFLPEPFTTFKGEK